MGKVEPISFPPFQLDAANERLFCGDQPITLRPKAFRLLLYLLQRPDQLVTKGELLEACWPETTVTDTVLKVCIREIREALADDPKSPRFIETAHRRGYRFIGRIAKAAVQGGDPEPHSLTETERPSGGYRDRGAMTEEPGDKKQHRFGDSGRLVLHSPLPPTPLAVGLVGRDPAL
ncbi:MAG TPA: transcriptional regulator, partial [Blastocatellia bacterium]|nr:transcriptional regulator [Blastocatellia bacterium]